MSELQSTGDVHPANGRRLGGQLQSTRKPEIAEGQWPPHSALAFADLLSQQTASCSGQRTEVMSTLLKPAL